MTRSKFSIKAVLLAGGVGLSMAAFAGSEPAAAQGYSDAYNCPAGYVNYPTSGCLPGAFHEPYDYEYPYGAYYGGLREFGHGMGAGGTIVDHGMGFHHSIVGVGHFGGGGFGHGMGMGIADGHNIGGGSPLSSVTLPAVLRQRAPSGARVFWRLPCFRY